MQYTKDSLPKPKNDSVQIKEVRGVLDPEPYTALGGTSRRPLQKQRHLQKMSRMAESCILPSKCLAYALGWLP